MARRLRALIVDDNRHVRHMVRSILEAGDAIVEEAASGDAALKTWREFRPHVMLVDFEMPGMSGARLTSEVRRMETASARTAIVLMTGHGDMRRIGEAMKAGVDGVVAKPFSTQQLLERVYAALSRAEAPSTSSAVGRRIA